MMYRRDDTVEVGAKLYEIDSDGVAAIATPAASSAPAAALAGAAKPSDAKETAATKSDSTTKSSSSSHRTPSIHFRGKSGWQALKTPGQVSSLTVAATKKPPSNNNPLAINVIYDNSIGSMYGRPKFSEAEMEALVMGGATLAPTVVATSSGASFSP
jgi:pyruvate/2-oxoglutarate dehydrogenase complex dihydrolipoamide acyltransferase (E2) component